jgi:hypothetical protein
MAQHDKLTKIFSAGVLFVEKHDSHGDVFHFHLTDKTEVCVWAYNRPDKLQFVHYKWDGNRNVILEDGRCEDLRRETRLYLERVGDKDRGFITIHKR